jgi:hypothetical protein
MKYRIAMWAGAGVLIAGFWALYFLTTTPIPMTSDNPIWTLVRITVPVVSASFYFHFPLNVYWSLLANTATFALIGLIAETLRQRLNPAR